MHSLRWAGLFAGPLLAVLCYALLPAEYRPAPGRDPVAFTAAGRVTLAVMAWMAVWWLTEAIDISATALLPLVLLPALRALGIDDAARPYAHPLIFLFLGGFLLALAMQRWGLDRRIALVTLRLVGDRPMGIVAGIMLATAVMSMFVSNSATAAMMLPIALSVVALLKRSGPGGAAESSRPHDNFAVCMMLGIAYAATIGGIATKIGTPPNGIVIGFIEDTYGEQIDFARWLLVGMPLVLVFGPLTWLLLTRVLYPVPHARIEGARELIASEHAALGPANRGERATFIVFVLTALAWMIRPILAGGIGEGPDRLLPALVPGLSDTGIAMAAALLLFVIPVDARTRTFVLDWETARRVPWGILVLFGGGLSLAEAVNANGVAEFIGSRVSGLGQDIPPLAVVIVVVAMIIFLTELTSNTATTATLVPVLAALAPGLGVHPYLLIVPAAIAASCAFMLPVGTPPNAIVFGSGHLTIPQMCKAGIWLNAIAIGLITALAFLVVRPVLGP